VAPAVLLTIIVSHSAIDRGNFTPSTSFIKSCFEIFYKIFVPPMLQLHGWVTPNRGPINLKSQI
jgi:hypothetical protein